MKKERQRVRFLSLQLFIISKEENEKVLKDYLLAQQKGVGCQLPTSSISMDQFKAAYQV